MEIKYIVQKGDTLWQIGKWYGVHWTELAIYNHLSNPHLIYPGDEILIPMTFWNRLKIKISQLLK